MLPVFAVEQFLCQSPMYIVGRHTNEKHGSIVSFMSARQYNKTEKKTSKKKYKMKVKGAWGMVG